MAFEEGISIIPNRAYGYTLAEHLLARHLSGAP